MLELTKEFQKSIKKIQQKKEKMPSDGINVGDFHKESKTQDAQWRNKRCRKTECLNR